MSHFENKLSSHPSPTVEDYLMTMHVLDRDHGEIVAARLVEQLGVTHPTVAMTLKRMERDCWITGKGRQGGIHLTEAGRSAAHSVVRRHMLTEWLLLKVLKVPYLQIHAEAHHLEHAISDAIEERLVDVLNSPQTCPHGNPLPGYEAVTKNWLPLIEFAAGDKVMIRRLHEFAEDNHDLLQFLIENDVMPGSAVTIVEVLPFNQTLTVNVNRRPVVLGFSAASSLYAESIKA
jgi:DtxR family transcriptional regulator, Mn-dependent transcriptional regulator